MLEQVLTNLLLNARDALLARPEGIDRRIVISAGPAAPGLVQLKVADTGGGIAVNERRNGTPARIEPSR